MAWLLPIPLSAVIRSQSVSTDTRSRQLAQVDPLPLSSPALDQGPQHPISHTVWSGTCKLDAGYAVRQNNDKA